MTFIPHACDNSFPCGIFETTYKISVLLWYPINMSALTGGGGKKTHTHTHRISMMNRYSTSVTVKGKCELTVPGCLWCVCVRAHAKEVERHFISNHSDSEEDSITVLL
jgi:hypothetical protein